MQFSAIRTRCAARFRDTGFAIVTDNQWKDYVNDALADVQAATPFWPWFEATSSVTVSANSHTAALPTNVVRVSSVLNDTDDIRMRPYEGASEHVADDPADTWTGPPTYYRVYGTTLYVYPKPTASTSVKLEYTVSSSELSSDSDLPPFPAEFHRILVVGALAKAYEDDANAPMAQVYDANFTALLEGLKVSMLAARQERYPGIVDDFWE